VSYQHCPACWVQQLGQTGFSFSGAGFGFVGSTQCGRWALGTRHGPDLEIVVIPDVVVNVDALATTRTYPAVSGPERRAAKQIGPTMAEDLGSIPQIL
jgi:hypothetical protein